MDNILLKYGSFITGLIILSSPVMGISKSKSKLLRDRGSIAKDYEYNSNLLLGLSHSIAKLAMTYKSF
jgi:hypothetical protein